LKVHSTPDFDDEFPQIFGAVLMALDAALHFTQRTHEFERIGMLGIVIRVGH
jgi:hypothetical protein